MKKILTILFALLTLSISASAQTQDEINQAIFDRVYQAVAPKADLPMPELVTEIALQFLGTDYVASTLEQTPEQLHVYLDKTDCILFVEMCSCFALTVKGLRIYQNKPLCDELIMDSPCVVKDKPSYELLCDNIRNMRYRGGVVDGYSSRIHYTSEWILQNYYNCLLYEYSRYGRLGEPYFQKFYFMSSHPQLYKQLSDTAQLMKIQQVESHLNVDLQPYFFISQERLRKPEVISQIHSGDIVCFVSKPGNGIDIAHVAIAYESEGEMHFIHASYGAKKVIVEAKTLADYATNGIRVCRFNHRLDQVK